MAAPGDPRDALLRWRLDDLPFGRIERERVSGDPRLFQFLAGASFIEIASDIYTRGLVDYFEGDERLTGWLTREWEPQELQHGAALRRYVEAVWPGFDWPAAYAHFRRTYAPLCKPELFGPSRGLELASRCVVETGTATFYTMIRDLTDEPVLRRLAALIRTDEVAHYSHFYSHFKRYREAEGLGRWPVLRSLAGRVAEFDSEDAWFAFRSVHAVTGGGTDARLAYDKYQQDALALMCAHYPFDMAAAMLLKPLALDHGVQRRFARWAAGAARQLMRLGSH